jgi:hypothetical protein
MTNRTGKADMQDRSSSSRQDRLKLALRENLKRRKLQARERDRTAEASKVDEHSASGRAGNKSDA